MVRAVFCYQKSGSSSKYNGLGWFLLSKVRKLKEIESFGLVFVIESQETQGNRMVGLFLLSKVTKLKQIEWFGLFFRIQKSRNARK